MACLVGLSFRYRYRLYMDRNLLSRPPFCMFVLTPPPPKKKKNSISNLLSKTSWYDTLFCTLLNVQHVILTFVSSYTIRINIFPGRYLGGGDGGGDGGGGGTPSCCCCGCRL
jgi:hypothetical protein